MRTQDTSYIYANIYDFKSKISQYLRLLEAGEYKAAVIQRYNEDIAMVVPINPRQKHDEKQ